MQVTTTPRLRPPVLLVAALCSLALCLLTLTPRLGVTGALIPNIVPLAGIFDLLFDNAATPAQIVKNIAGNVLLLAPLGVLFHAGFCWTRRRSPGDVAVASLFIEVVEGLG